MKKLELLAPAKNLECGLAAIDHGADAVYIGAPRFGARAAAGNSLDDIRQLCEYAHLFGARVHVTVNTIIYDDELEDTLQMVGQLDHVGVDALLLQDMGVLSEIKSRHLWSHDLHASTQCDSRTADKVRWLSSLGFDRVVLARELSLSEIRDIHKQVPDSELEVFVHGALCVSYSGVCYASEQCFGRSANRGECAQFCRMKFDLVDSDGREIEHQRHLLSLKDLCQIEHLQELADAGATSFKIEGRLKDASYVKNVVAAYSRRLDEIVSLHPDKYCRASQGRVEYFFEPNLKKTFNRGFTNYFLDGRQPDIASFDTPKAIGEYVGKVKEMRGNISFNVATVASFANGDGLCFINDEHELEGFRVNRVQGNRLFPFRMPEHLRPGMPLYRNNDRSFEAILARKTACRRIPIKIELKPTEVEKDGITKCGITATAYLLSLAQKHGVDSVSIFHEFALQPAKRPQRENMIVQLTKLGETIYECQSVKLLDGIDSCFVPNSVLTAIRRQLIEAISHSTSVIVSALDKKSLDANLQMAENTLLNQQVDRLVWNPEYGKWGYLYNIANKQAKQFYQLQGLSSLSPAFELAKPIGDKLIMQCRHCIRYSLGYCVKRGGKRPTWKEPLYLQLGDGRRFRLDFVCKECQMNVLY